MWSHITKSLAFFSTVFTFWTLNTLCTHHVVLYTIQCPMYTLHQFSAMHDDDTQSFMLLLKESVCSSDEVISRKKWLYCLYCSDVHFSKLLFCTDKFWAVQCSGGRYSLARGSAVDLDESVTRGCKKVDTQCCSGLMGCLHCTLE